MTVQIPELPGPSDRDTPEVAKLVATAAELWAEQRYADALTPLLNAALLAASRKPGDDPRVKELARAATEVSAYVNSPGSIAVSIDVSNRGLTPAAPLQAAPSPAAPSSRAQPPGGAPSVPKRVRKGTLPEESRPAPDTVRAEPEVPPPPTIDMSGTVPQGYRPAPSTKKT